jgi:hypothetical protein
MRLLLALALGLAGCLLSGKEVGKGDDVTTPDGGSGTGDGGSGCGPDVFEPNNSTGQATPTGIDGATSFSNSFSPVSICNSADHDFFRIDLMAGGMGIDATAFSQKAPPVNIALLNSGGTTIANGQISPTDGVSVRVCVQSLPPGTVFIEAQGPTGDYSLDISVVPMCN